MELKMRAGEALESVQKSEIAAPG